MSILGILFSVEERAMIKRAARDTWEREHPPGPEFSSQTGNYVM
jgi:hypothetical protein